MRCGRTAAFNYADYALSPEFRAGLDDNVLGQGDGARLTVMCPEAVWWRCHRRIVADLIARGARGLFTSWARAAGPGPC